MLGVLNGLCGVDELGNGAIVAEFDYEDGSLLGFRAKEAGEKPDKKTMDSEKKTEAAGPDISVVWFDGDMWECRPRKLWQKLFDFYRQNGCPLDNMDNILIDLRSCTRAFEESRKGTVRFLWGCDPGYYPTTWTDIKEGEQEIKNIMYGSGFEWLVLCELTEDRATFTVQSASK